jgi:biotin carboxyl carrier protein
MSADSERSRSPVDSTDDQRLAATLRHEVPAMLDALAGSAVEEIQLDRGGVRLRLRRAVQEAPPADALDASDAASLASAPAVEPELPPGPIEVRSAGVGVFHRSREPGGLVLVEEGAHVEAGAAIGVVETLGMSADAEAPAAGRLVELRVQDDEPVEYGQVLALIEPD